MRRATVLMATLGLLVGCGGSEGGRAVGATDTPSSAPAAPSITAEAAPGTTAEAPQLDPAAAEAFLAALRSESPMGDYRDAELVFLAALFCENRRAGLEPLAGGVSPGDGTYRFDGVDVPVEARDAIWIDLLAQEYVCRDTI